MANLRIENQLNMGENTEFFDLLPLQALSTATRQADVYDNPGATGIMIVFVVANEAGTFSGQIKIQAVDEDGNKYILHAFTAVVANGTTIYVYHPVDNVGSGITESVAGSLPRVWSVQMLYAGTPATDKADTTVKACLLL